MQIHWSGKYAVNHEIIDTQHKHLLEIINKISLSIIEGESTDIIEQILNEMSEYAIDHFSTEEALLKCINQEALEDHKSLHDDFKKEIIKETNAYLINPSEAIAVSIHRFLRTWWINHILEEDMKCLK